MSKISQKDILSILRLAEAYNNRIEHLGAEPQSLETTAWWIHNKLNPDGEAIADKSIETIHEVRKFFTGFSDCASIYPMCYAVADEDPIRTSQLEEMIDGFIDSGDGNWMADFFHSITQTEQDRLILYFLKD